MPLSLSTYRFAQAGEDKGEEEEEAMNVIPKWKAGEVSKILQDSGPGADDEVGKVAAPGDALGGDGSSPAEDLEEEGECFVLAIRFSKRKWQAFSFSPEDFGSNLLVT